MSTMLAREYRYNDIKAMNRELDAAITGGQATESFLNHLLDWIEANMSPWEPAWWLIWARLTEGAILTAGRYADAAEFRAAGDLMVNPRKISVYFKSSPHPLFKKRHGRLSDQFNTRDLSNTAFIKWFSRNAIVEQSVPPLLPYLMGRLETSGYISDAYLTACRRRMEKIAGTLAFLITGGVEGFEDLAARRAGAGWCARDLLEDHLCRFGTGWFVRIGEELEQYPHQRSKVLTAWEDLR